MSFVFDLYVPGSSWLHILDARVKLWATVVGVIAAFLVPNLLFQILLLASIHLLLLSAKVPLRSLIWLWRQMGILIMLILILQPFFMPAGRILLTLGPLSLTLGGVESAMQLASRALTIAFVTAGLVFTTEQNRLVQAFVRLGLPYSWGLTISLTLRFLPAIQNLFLTIREAQSARGWVVEGNIIHRTRQYIPVLVSTVIGTLRMSDQLTLALAARGLKANTKRTTWHPLIMRRQDWSILVIVTLGFVLLLWWRLS